jgi:hypothetical protein
VVHGDTWLGRRVAAMAVPGTFGYGKKRRMTSRMRFQPGAAGGGS